ncbi:MAG: sugar O-acetyltransferase [Clostridium sp.]|nr:sugar O-acetyltransferase [Clostridium sp.]
MTEKEKAMAGMLYDANYDEALAEERLQCKDLCWEYNQLKPSREKERKELIKRILNKTGETFWIEPSFWCDYGYNIEIGENFYSNHNLVILDGARVTFGDNCFIAPNCGFYTAGHALDVEQRNKGLEIALPITIGNNVWIGGNVVVLPGVTIGDDTVIGGGSVVTKDIPSGVIAAGNPCKVIREITEADKNKYKRAWG